MSDNVIEIKKAYTLRALQTKDIFLMSKILGKIGVDKFIKDIGVDNIVSMTKDGNVEDILVKIGANVALNILNVVINNLPSCEKDVYAFMSSLSGIKEKEIETLGMVEFTEMVVDVIKKEEFKGFIKVVSSLFK